MRNKIIMGMLALCSFAFSAKLNYTEKRTPSYRGDIIKYANYTQKGYPVFNILYDSRSGMSRPENWINDLGFDVRNLKLLRGGDPSIEKKFYSQDNDHVITMFSAFDTEMGGGYVKNNLQSVVYASRLLPANTPSGIIAVSTYAHAGSTGFMTSGSVYFGDTINELAGGYHQSSRLLGLTSNNNNLWVSAFGNDDSIDPENRMGGDDVSAAAPSQETFYFPMFGEEVQKMSRSDQIKVKDFVCTGKANPVKSLPQVRGIDGPQKNFPNNSCSINDDNDRTSFPFYALYARTHTVTADGQAYAAGKASTGSSFAVPRVSALARKVMMKFPGISYLQAKDIILTTARRDKEELDSYMGWGIADHDKALRGPSALNAGLLEEQKFYTGMYDKIFDLDGNVYFWAEPETDWTWDNDIYGNFPRHPEGEIVLNTAVNTADRDGDIIQTRLAFKTVKDLTFKRYIPSEANYYKDTAWLKPGLRKAGSRTLTINGNIYYEGPTQVLQGRANFNGDVKNSTITVYEGAEIRISGNAEKVVLAGGGLILSKGAEIGTLEIDPKTSSRIYMPDEGGNHIGAVVSSPEKIKQIREIFAKFPNTSISSEKTIDKGSASDVDVNVHKFQDLKREYFLSGFSERISRTSSDADILSALRRRYTPIANAPREMLETVPGYSDGTFALDRYHTISNQEFSRYINPISVNDSFRQDQSSWEWTNFYEARKKAGID